MRERPRGFRFGVFEVDLQAGELRRDGLKMRIQDQPFQVLTLLLDRPGEVMSRDEIRNRLWPQETFVDFDHSLNTAINKLRESLGDSAENPRFIATVPRKGYRFLHPVESIGGEQVPEVLEPAASAKTRRQASWWALALTAVALGAVVWVVLRPGGVPPVERLTIAPREPFTTPIISPDGKLIAYISGEGNGKRLSVQKTNEFTSQDIAGSEGALEFPFWSPDSREVVFVANGFLWKSSLAGGEPVRLCPVNHYLGGAWDPARDAMLFCVDRAGIYEVPAGGGTPKLLVPIDRTRWGDHFEHPRFVRSTRSARILLYIARTRDNQHGLVVHDLESGKQNLIGPGLQADYSSTGHILVSRPGQFTIWALPFSPETLRVTGEAIPLAQSGVVPHPSVSSEGTLAYMEQERRSRLSWRDRRGNSIEIADEPGNWLGSFTLSPDASKAAVIRWDPTNPGIWIGDVSRHIWTRLTHGESYAARPLWHPDARTLTFLSVRDGNADIFSLPADRPGKATPLVNTPLDEIPNDWSRDGKFLLYEVRDLQNKWDLWYLRKRDTGDYERVPFLQTPFNESHATFAPDRGYVAYTSDESGRLETYVQQFPKGPRQQVSAHGGVQPRWRKDGRELFYIEGDRLMSVPLTTGKGFSAGIPAPLFQMETLREYADPGANTYAVSPDGDRILVRERVGQKTPPVIRIIRGWTYDLRARRK